MWLIAGDSMGMPKKVVLSIYSIFYGLSSP